MGVGDFGSVTGIYVAQVILGMALLHESVEVDRTLLPDAQAVISTL